MATRILLADDHTIVREGLRSIIEHEMGMEVVALAGSGNAAVDLARAHRPEVVVIDITMPGMNGIEATRQILRELPSVKVIALSMHASKDIVSEMLKAGASAYLLKDSAVDELGLALKSVLSGKFYISPEITGTVVGDYVVRLTDESSSAPKLTGREREVLQLIAEGKSMKEIAAALKLSVKTIETYRQTLMNRLNIHNIAELTKYAVREGLTPLE